MLKILTTFFYVGYLPLPGTSASIAGLFLVYFIKGNPVVYIAVTLFLILLGFILTSPAERLFAKKDARCIVIDEVCGILLSLTFMPYDIRLMVIAFFLFRILDTLKPFPAGRLENIKGSFGIMGDDIVAGLYANLILQVVLRLAWLKVS